MTLQFLNVDTNLRKERNKKPCDSNKTPWQTILNSHTTSLWLPTETIKFSLTHKGLFFSAQEDASQLVLDINRYHWCGVLAVFFWFPSKECKTITDMASSSYPVFSRYTLEFSFAPCQVIIIYVIGNCISNKIKINNSKDLKSIFLPRLL